MGEVVVLPRRVPTGAQAILSQGCELYAIHGLTGDRVAIIHRGEVVVLDGPRDVSRALIADFKARVRARRASRRRAWAETARVLLTLACVGAIGGLAAGLLFFLAEVTR